MQQERPLTPKSPQEASRYSSLESELVQTAEWILQWHEEVREQHGLTARKLAEARGLLTLTEDEEETCFGWTVALNQHSVYGNAHVIQITRFTENPSHPLIARLIYTDPLMNTLRAVSFGWRREQSQVVYELATLRNEKIEKIGRIDRAGTFFKVPTHYLVSQLTQMTELDFSWAGRNIAHWEGKLGFEYNPLGKASFRNGVLTSINGTLTNTANGSQVIPNHLDPKAHTKQLARHKPREPFLPY